MTHTVPPLVISMTDFAAFTRCPESFYLGHVLKRNGVVSGTVNKGTEIHSILEDVARFHRQNTVLGQESLPVHEREVARQTAEMEQKYSHEMMSVAVQYLYHNPLRGRTLMLEEPLYTLVIEEEGNWPYGKPAVYIRTTFDRVADDDGDILCVDYKSFDQKPTFDDDKPNFQAGTYSGVLRRHFGHHRITFCTEHIRQCPPGTPRTTKEVTWIDDLPYTVTKDGKRTPIEQWTPEECYYHEETILTDVEDRLLWRDLQETAREIREKILDANAWYRRKHLKGGPHSCDNCFMRYLCTAHFRTGALDTQDLEMHSSPRDDAERMSVNAMLRDPRVLFYEEHNNPSEVAVQLAYGVTGYNKLLVARTEFATVIVDREKMTQFAKEILE